MSASPQGNRTRLKLISSNPQDNSEGSVYLQSFPPTTGTITAPIMTSEGMAQKELEAQSSDEPAHLSRNGDASDDLQAAAQSLSELYAPVAAPSAALSDNSSSSLSEIEENLDDNEEAAIGYTRQNLSEDSESEVATERLEISPQKNNERALAAIEVRRSYQDLSTPTSGLDALAEAAQPMIGENGVNEAPSQNLARERSNGVIRLSLDLTGRKRKRSGPLSTTSSTSLSEEEKSSKRSSSASDIRASPDSVKFPTASAVVVPDDGSEPLSEVSSPSELTATVEDMVEPAAESPTGVPDALRDDMSDLESDEPASDHEMVDVADLVEDVIVKPEEGIDLEETAGHDVEDEEADVAGKSEDELARKKNALEALVPIEKLFAIFRDQLFEERIGVLTHELEVLNNPQTIHAEYLAMRQCLDMRRDERIQLAHTELFYKQRVLENTVVAARSQSQSQYHQNIRAIREKYIDNMNELFCNIQRERRQLQTREPQFGYAFEPNRSKQILQQTAYNKEVSLLSGIARYVGFPGAPEMQSARSMEVDDDFKAMQIKAPAPPKPYTAQISSTRATEGPVEESFLEKNPWANPNHPSHQQSLIDRPPTTTQNARASHANNVTPSTNKRAPNWIPSDLQGSAGSTIPAQSDPPSSAAGAPALLYRNLSNGNSPFEHHTSRKEVSNRDREAGRERELLNPTTTSAPNTRPASRFERPYKPKNMPPASFPLSPPQALHTPVPRAANVGFLHAGYGNSPGPAVAESIASARVKEDNANRYSSPAGFAMGSSTAATPGAAGPRPMGVVEGLGTR